MAASERVTYISIPPPPLPEFYRKSKRHKEQPSSSTSPTVKVDKETFVIKQKVIFEDDTDDDEPGCAPSRPFVTVSRPRHTTEVPPLAIYHICRICLRPRSPRYHREHPIPIDGLPPPPGICRRCRVTSYDDTKKITEIVKKSESNPIKIGCITPFIRDEDIVSNEEMKRMKVEKYLRSRPSDQHQSRHRSKSRKDIVYRHVKVVDAPGALGTEDEDVADDVVEEAWVPTKRKVVFTSQDAIRSFKDAVTPEPLTAPKTTTTSMQVQATTNPSIASSISVKQEALRAMDSAAASVSARASSTSGSGSKSTVRASVKASTHSRPAYGESDVRKMARDEIEKYAQAMQRPEQRHAEIRQLAREEVERYRQAERKLEAHPDGFAHGKLVPVARRIDVERDVIETMPWVQHAKKATSIANERSTKSDTVERDFAYDSVISDTGKSKSKSGSTDKAWASGRRQEVSIERPSRYDASPPAAISQRSELAAKTQETSQMRYQNDNIRSDMRSSKFQDRVQESGGPRWTAKTEPYRVETSRHPTEDQNNDIRAMEDIDLPPRLRAASYRREERRNPGTARPDPERVRVLRQDTGVDSRQATSSVAGKRTYSTKQQTRDYYLHEESVNQAAAAGPLEQIASIRGGGAESGVQAQVSFPAIERSAQASTHSRVTFQDDQSSDNTRWSRKHRLAEEGRAGGPAPRQHLPYPEDNVMPDHSSKPTRGERDTVPAKEPTQHSNSSKHPNSEYVYIERTVQPADRDRGSRPYDDHPPHERIETEETYVVRRHPQAQDPVRTGRKGQGERHTRESDQSKHMKFNKKVEISPTPPGSDASSSAFRSFHSIGARSGGQVDGNEDARGPGDITGEYERHGRTRSRDSRTRHFHEQERIYERPDGEWVVQPKQAAWVSGSVQLERPLSESPSREELIISSSTRCRQSDGRGPYREQEKVTDSMHVEDGSPGGRAWRGNIGGSMHSSIGQAAQVFW